MPPIGLVPYRRSLGNFGDGWKQTALPTIALVV
jgi:hypothetical protein